MIRQTSAYTCSDGTVFTDYSAAMLHERVVAIDKVCADFNEYTRKWLVEHADEVIAALNCGDAE